jgi:hypothetical protein
MPEESSAQLDPEQMRVAVIFTWDLLNDVLKQAMRLICSYCIIHIQSNHYVPMYYLRIHNVKEADLNLLTHYGFIRIFDAYGTREEGVSVYKIICDAVIECMAKENAMSVTNE